MLKQLHIQCGFPGCDCLGKPSRLASRAFGVTILELLIVIPSITSLASLVLPAVLATHESGRDQQCVNQLGRISAALHSYEEARGALPAGWDLEPSKWSGYVNNIDQFVYQQFAKRR